MKMEKMKDKNRGITSFWLALFLPAMLIALIGCNEIFEKNIREDMVEILSPVDSTHSSSRLIYFLWNELEGADQYHLRIVSPDFTTTTEILVDTILTTTNYNYTFPNLGVYQWSLQAVNHGYETDTIEVRTLYIDSIDYSVESVVLLSPDDNAVSDTMVVYFEWDAFPGADHYLFEIGNPDFSTGTLVSQTLTKTNYNHTFTANETYEWRVSAFNSTGGQSQLNNTRILEVDTAISVVVGTPGLIEPLSGTVEQTEAAFRWGNQGSYDFDSIYIYEDSAQTTLLNGYPHESLNQRDTLVELDSAIYYWKVRSFSNSGSSSQFSDTWVIEFQ